MVVLLSCRQQKPTVVIEESLGGISTDTLGKDKLSSYGFFKGQLRDLDPAEGVIAYELNSPLFSDYAYKKRFIKMPRYSSATYHADDVLDFPDGTILIKTFYYPMDFREPEKNLRLLETRLLIRENNEWIALPYLWNEDQTEAFLDVAGGNMEVSWIHTDGTRKQLLYSVPNLNQCAGCHIRGDKIMPIGPTARQLNLTKEGEAGNQLQLWSDLGFLTGLPPLHQVPKLVAYDDENAPIDLRARAWLEVNCAHCHRPDGPARTSGLHLMADVTKTYELGIGKAPVAAGRGSGGLDYDIVPGEPDKSILFYRIQSQDPGVMMPELGKKLVHTEGVELVREWIAKLKTDGV